MTRIIGGRLGGRRLKTPPGEGTRPTSDRVREALFSALEAELGSLQGTRFLDLYAGSGAVGLEAVSRGAVALTAVEADRRAAGVVRANAGSLGVAADVRAQPVERVVAGGPAGPAYDVVFLDPPYAQVGEVPGVLGLLLGRGWLDPDAVVVVETGRRTPEPAWPEGLVLDRRRLYGETVLWYLRGRPRPEAAPGHLLGAEPSGRSAEEG